MSEFLAPGDFIDSQHRDVLNYAFKAIGDASDENIKAVLLYYAIRDGFPYNPFLISFNPAYLHSSFLIQKKQGHCVDKASFLVACCRGVGIPSKIGMAKVKNHIGTARLEELLKSNILVPHGYAELFIKGKWVKATPAFNKELCEKLGVEALEFDGASDSLFQAYDKQGELFMEYIEDFGSFADLPIALYQREMQKEYPHLFNQQNLKKEYLFD